MGRKVVLIAAVMLTLSFAFAGPAEAKMMSLHHVEVTGPGIDGTLTVSRTEFGRIKSQWSPAARALDGVHSPFEKEPRPPGVLGPRFKITYVEEWFMDEPKITRLAAHLYPYAEGGPVTYVLPNQRQDPFEPRHLARAGWLPYPRPLIEKLRAAGLPAKEAATGVTATDTSTAWPWVITGLALALVLWLAGLGATRRDHRLPIGVLFQHDLVLDTRGQRGNM